MKNAYLLTGSNIGDRLQQLNKAARLINEKAGSLQRLSSVYETEAWGITDQPSFYNQALHITTLLEPAQLLTTLLCIEEEMGRVRKEKFGPRIIDIDILLIDSLIVHTPSLIVPHPFLQERNFALQPLAEIAPLLVHPLLNTTIEELIRLSTDTLECTIISPVSN